MTHYEPNLPLDARYTSLSDREPEELLLKNMPAWLSGPRATPEIIHDLDVAMGLSRAFHAQVGKQFSELKSVDDYCRALLKDELSRHFGSTLNTDDDYLVVANEQVVIQESLLLSLQSKITYEAPKTLLWAALQNFASEETLSKFSHFSKGGHPVSHKGIDATRFAKVCRNLDLGSRYQTYLQDFLNVAVPGSATLNAEQAATHSALELLKAYDLEVDTHVAFLRNNISESAYRALLSLVAHTTGAEPAVQVMLDAKPILQSALSILDTVVDGVVVFSADSLLMHPTHRLIVYIPNDPVSPLHEYPSLPAFIDVLKTRLSQSAYQKFFRRYIALTAQPTFLQSLKSMPPALALTAQPLGMTVSHYLVSSHLKKMFADAQVLAVPTHLVDERERERTWQSYKSAGLFLVNVAAFFVPGLGELMLAVAVGQMLLDVYEGVEDWTHGDIDHARSHLLNVAKDIAVSAAMVAGTVVVTKAVGRLSQAAKVYVKKFEPITREDGTERLWNRGLEHYQYKELGSAHEVADTLGFFTIRGKKYVEIEGKKYRVEFDQNIKQWRIVHPQRKAAFKPALLHNREGAWQHAHERPLEWQGSRHLVGRLGPRIAQLDDVALERIMQLTHTSQDVLREVHLENLPTPPLLKVTLKRFEIDRQLNVFISHMAKGEHTPERFAHLQLMLMPLLPGWPVGKELILLDASGAVKRQYGNPQWAKINSSLRVPASASSQGKLLETMLQALSEQERQPLISPYVAVTPEAAQAVAQQLATYAREHRPQMLERMYERFNVSKNPAAKSIQVVFPGLPKPAAEELAMSASAAERESLLLNKVPQGVAEHARVLLQEARLNRALEGFYLDLTHAQDTEKLICHFLTRLNHWPTTAAFEVREGSISAPAINSFGAVGQTPARVLVSSAQGYRCYSQMEGIYIVELGEASSFSTAIFHGLTNSERSALGFPEIEDAPKFNDALAKLAIEARAESSKVLGMQPIKPGYKPPLRMSGGRLGYPLCGFDSGAYSSSLRRRVRDLYRAMSDDQVEQYLDSLVEKGLDPLAVLRQKKREKRELSWTLQSWIERPRPPGSSRALINEMLESEYHAGVLIMRAWFKNPEHMPWGAGTTSFTLSLDGLRLAELPPLPTSADFRHIHILNLNNMSFSHGINEFLAHFPKLTMLQLDNNRLSVIPSQLTFLPNLNNLSLVRNQIVLNEPNNAVLKALTKLETLNLSHNPLGEVDFAEMPYLRRVFLRNAAITEWPRGLITRPFLEMADLRENQITEIPAEVYRMSSSILQNTSLTGNPLSAASRLRLARFVMQGGRSMGVRSETMLTETSAFDFWTLGITNSELARRSRLWSDLRAYPGSDDFFDVITRLVATADAQSIRPDMTRRVWEMIEAVTENERIRFDILDVAATPRSCTDSVAMTFSALEQQMQLSKIALDSSTQEAALLTFAKRLFRLDQLSRIAAEDYNARLSASGSGPMPDELEIHLAYRVGLANELELPNQPHQMMFSVVAGVTPADLSRAHTEINFLEQTSALVKFVSTRDFWKEYLISLHMSEVTEMTEPFFQNLSQLLRQSPDMSSERYLRRVTEIRDEQERVIAAWCLRKTQDILPLPGPSRASTPSVELEHPLS